MYVCMYVCMYACMYVCVYVYACVWIHIQTVCAFTRKGDFILDEERNGYVAGDQLLYAL